MITNKIEVPYTLNSVEVMIPITYDIDMRDNKQVITCTISTGNFYAPAWLQIRKFELKSVLIDGIYMPLFSDNENIKNIHASLFIDKAYESIMAKENFILEKV